MEGSFDNDVLIGDTRPNAMLGQPGKDSFFGRGGEDMIDARDGVRDFSHPVRHQGHPEGRAIIDPFDPPPDGLRRAHLRLPGGRPQQRRLTAAGTAHLGVLARSPAERATLTAP